MAPGKTRSSAPGAQPSPAPTPWRLFPLWNRRPRGGRPPGYRHQIVHPYKNPPQLLDPRITDPRDGLYLAPVLAVRGFANCLLTDQGPALAPAPEGAKPEPEPGWGGFKHSQVKLYGSDGLTLGDTDADGDSDGLALGDTEGLTLEIGVVCFSRASISSRIWVIR